MHDHEVLIFLVLMILLFGLVSKVSERWLVTGPMVFMLVGVLVSPLGLDLFTMHTDTDTVKLIAEITLILILFVDASLIKLDVLRSAPSRIPARLLGIGLPLTMLCGFALGALLFDGMTLWGIALIALILSPTDAALGQAVVKSESVPSRIRQSISVESGLNDGIALPPILVCFAALGAESSGHEGAWLGFMLKQLTFGPLIGVLVGWIGGRLIERASQLGWMESTFQRLAAFSLALLAYALAEAVEGNGFIAAFAAGIGLSLGIRDAGSHELLERIQETGEAAGALLLHGVFLLLGLAAIPIAVGYWGWTELLYAVASLTVIRMLPVAISLIGTKSDVWTILFIGWFGPRGIASVLYLLLAISAIGLAGHEHMFSIIVLTVTLSVLAHGVTAVPLCNRYAAKIQDLTPRS